MRWQRRRKPSGRPRSSWPLPGSGSDSNRRPLAREKAQTGEANAQTALSQAQERLALAPLDAEQRHLNLLKAQTAERLELAGLSDNAVATGQAAVQQAQQELSLAERRVALATTQATREDAQTAAATARTPSLRRSTTSSKPVWTMKQRPWVDQSPGGNSTRSGRPRRQRRSQSATGLGQCQP